MREREREETVCTLSSLPSVGDALCTIAASCGYPEPFLLPSGQKRLTFMHKKYVGRYHSDHLAMLSVFHEWEQAR